MFDALSDKLQAVFQQLGKKGRLGEKDVDEALRQVRLALLEADVHFRVVRGLVERVRARALGAEVLQSLTPAHQVVKIVHDELMGVLGEPGRLATSTGPPVVMMLVGLQGSGKTTTAAKLALQFKRQGQHPMLVPADPYRPAARDQLQILAEQVDVGFYNGPEPEPAALCRAAAAEARRGHFNPLILDTAGRLQTDEELMAELEAIRDAVSPAEVLLVADSTIGQEALRVAETFHTRIGLTGVVLTKLDGDTRGGAALSMREVTGVPLKLLGTGEGVEALEPFHPDRLASRILGMGDVLTLVERAQQATDTARVEELQRKLQKGTFDLEDFLEQLRQVRRMGPLDQIMKMIPGLGRHAPKDDESLAAEGELRRAEAIILSMTPAERQRPEIIGASRRRRIARGSGTSTADVNQVLGQFRQIHQLMRNLPAAGGKANISRLFR